MGWIELEGAMLTPLKKIPNPQGNILHAMKISDPGYRKFGEAYFSIVKPGEVKAWKKHRKMTLNIVVPVGEVKFVMFDDRPESSTKGLFCEVTLSLENYQRLTVPPCIWLGFKGTGQGLNMLLNMADTEHDPEEADKAGIYEINYDW